MTRPRINLEPHRDLITAAYNSKDTYEAIRSRLEREFGLQVSARTLQRQLLRWQAPRHQERTVHSAGLPERLRHLFFEIAMTDEEILTALRQEGFVVSKRGVVQARRQHGMFRRLSPERLLAIQEELRAFFEDERGMANHACQMGKGSLYTHIRQQQFSIARDPLWDVYREFHAASIEERLQRVSRRRGGWTCPGPNYQWCIDGYCKLAQYGFSVYGGIDAYSRFVVWLYVGVSANTARNVLAQYLAIVKAAGYIPEQIRADRGVETPLVAGAHYFLARQASMEHPNTERTFEQCFIYGKSTRNIKIESWWEELSRSRAVFWRVRIAP